MEFAATCFKKLRDSNYSCEPNKNCGCCEIGVTEITELKQKMDKVINNTIPNHPWSLPEYWMNVYYNNSRKQEDENNDTANANAQSHV